MLFIIIIIITHSLQFFSGSFKPLNEFYWNVDERLEESKQTNKTSSNNNQKSPLNVVTHIPM